MRFLIAGLLATCLFCASLTSNAEAAEILSVPVTFKKGSTSVERKGSIRGYEVREYIVHATSGQSLSADMNSSNTAAYFNVLPPRSDIALFIGTIGGSSWSGIIHDSGDYRIRVYLMRSAAHRDETASYTLRVSLSGHAVDAAKALPKKFVNIKTSPFRATGSLPCSMGDDENRSKQCAFGVIRGKPGNAVVIITKPEGNKRILTFMDGNVTVEGNSTLRSRKIDDMWYININGKEHYQLPDLVIFGD